MQLAINDERVGWAHDAIIYDEKPLTLVQSWRQRKRWMQGHADVASRFFGKLMKKAFKEGKFLCFDCAISVSYTHLKRYEPLRQGLSESRVLHRGIICGKERAVYCN